MLHPKIKQRDIHQETYQSLSDLGLPEILARIVAGRLPQGSDNPEKIINPKLTYLDNPFLLKDMDIAVNRLIQAIEKNEIIGIETDHDCDGQTSHAVIYEALSQWFNHPKEKIRSYIGHRMEEGYGLSEALANRILNDTIKPSLIITADNGSTDEPRIEKLKEEKIDTIVTDHHAIPVEGIPKSAIATLNPTREDCQFPDPSIAGCMVSWLFMAAVRRKLIDDGKIDAKKSNPASVLDFVAVGTVADCVSMAKSVNNRAVVKAGLEKIKQSTRPCWQALKELFPRKINAEYLGFSVGPLLNSDGRLSDAHSSVSFLLSETVEEAIDWVNELSKQNQKRKAIQQKMLDQSMKLAFEQVKAGKSSICLFLDDGHAGVHGIAASRLKDSFGRPVVFFSPKINEDEIITASARSIDSIHLKEILDEINEKDQTMFVKYGGHKGAAGLTIKKTRFDDFSQLFEEAINQKIEKEHLGPELLIDGMLDYEKIDLDTFYLLEQIEPFGREFDVPLFKIEGQLISKRFVGQGMQHLQLLIATNNGKRHKGIWFFASRCDHVFGFENKMKLALICRLNEEEFNNKRSLGLMVEYAYEIE